MKKKKRNISTYMQFKWPRIKKNINDAFSFKRKTYVHARKEYGLCIGVTYNEERTHDSVHTTQSYVLCTQSTQDIVLYTQRTQTKKMDYLIELTILKFMTITLEILFIREFHR